MNKLEPLNRITALEQRLNEQEQSITRLKQAVIQLQERLVASQSNKFSARMTVCQPWITFDE
jgi:uncharacterized coiled-coil protein SlyX